MQHWPFDVAEGKRRGIRLIVINAVPLAFIVAAA